MNDELLRAELGAICRPENVSIRLVDRLVYAHDASSYRIVPRAVVRPAEIEEIRRLFSWSEKTRIPLTFRAAGTSLSGQSLGSGIIVEIARKWSQFQMLANGAEILSQPGIIADRLNSALKKCNRKIGPDPASIHSCTVGGILANNSSGMCCGVRHNSYHTVKSLSYLLPDGTFINTANTTADTELAVASPKVHAGILDLKREILSKTRLVELIRRKYRIKNTVGYSLNAFLDEKLPAQILAKLMIGSEGTLGFIAEAVFSTLPDKPFKATCQAYFSGVRSACSAIAPLRDAGAETLELMDRAALRSVESRPGAPVELRALPDEAAALLIEFQALTIDDLDALESNAQSVLSGMQLLAKPRFTRDASERAQLWKIRKGMFPAVGAARDSGTGIINEDVAFPVEHLADAVTDLQQIFRDSGYTQAIIFGHAKDGNLHFVLTQAFDTQQDIDRYDRLMQAVASLVIEKYGGSFKAEHGTGRNAAPFVEQEWGAELYDIMRRLKNVVDPNSILNPGVILNDDPKAHVTHVKTFPRIDPIADKCIECGYCESHCPSANLTLTPRGRIVVMREISALQGESNQGLAQDLADMFHYDGVETCATDGLCALACPVGIDTGSLMKQMREQGKSQRAQAVAGFLAKNVGTAVTMARVGAKVANTLSNYLGNKTVTHIAKLLKPVFGGYPPVWRSALRTAPGRLPNTSAEQCEYVYFPACIGRIFGKHGDDELQNLVLKLAKRAGVPVFLPRESSKYCCGMSFQSKGFPAAAGVASQNLGDALQRWSLGGRTTVITDANSCAYTMRSLSESHGIRVIDTVEFAAKTLLPRLTPKKVQQKAAIHPTCSAVKAGLTPYFEQIASACSEEFYIADSHGCCGFAGDRGIFLPELPASATEIQAEEIRNAGCTHGYSGNVTCEIAMTEATGIYYRSILFLLEEATR